jgi:predicted DNA-binding transcriptional regulator YafY
VQVLAETFERPLDFNLQAFVYDSIAFAPAPWRVEVWLASPPEELALHLPRAKAVLEADGSGTRLRCGVADLEEFALLLLHVGCAFEVRQPQELVEAFQVVARRALDVTMISSR